MFGIIRQKNLIVLTSNQIYFSSNLNINDVLGNYSLTLIDALDTLAVSSKCFLITGGKNKNIKYCQKLILKRTVNCDLRYLG